MIFEKNLINRACSLELTLLTQKTEEPRIGWRGTNGFSGKILFTILTCLLVKAFYIYFFDQVKEPEIFSEGWTFVFDFYIFFFFV